MRRHLPGRSRGSDATTGLQGAKWTLWNKFHKVMTPSQAAMADARRNKLCDAYAAVREAARERQREYHGNQHDKPQAGLVEQIPQVHATNDDAEAAIGKPPAPQTRDIRAKAAGSGRGHVVVSNMPPRAGVMLACRHLAPFLRYPATNGTAPRSWRASWISSRRRPMSAAVAGGVKPLESATVMGLPSVATSPRSCAASYSSSTSSGRQRAQGGVLASDPTAAPLRPNAYMSVTRTPESKKASLLNWPKCLF